MEARHVWADYIWFLDIDSFITNRNILQYLMIRNVAVVAPMLKSLGMYSNYWCGMDSNYYYVRTDDYTPILERKTTGCFNVPMIHSSVLVDLRTEVAQKISFLKENLSNYSGPEDDIILFALSAKQNDIPLYICNTDEYGYIMVPLEEDHQLSSDYHQVVSLIVEISADGPAIHASPLLSSYVTYPTPTKLGFDQVYLINLVRRWERRERMEYCFKELGIDAYHLPAVDGKLLNETYIHHDLGITFLEEYRDPYHKRKMTYGEIGCFLSHYNIWREMLSEGYERVLVFEDDIRFEPYFVHKLHGLLVEVEELGLDWDLIYLGRKRLRSDEAWVDGSSQLVHVDYTYWTLCYMLSRKGARKLVEQKPLEKLLPVDEYLPIMFDRHPEEEWKRNYSPRDLVAFSTAPLLVYPTHYTGEVGYISDTEDSGLVDEDEEICDV